MHTFTHTHSLCLAPQVLMTFGRKNSDVAEGVSIISDSLLITAIFFVVWSSMFPHAHRPPAAAAAPVCAIASSYAEGHQMGALFRNISECQKGWRVTYTRLTRERQPGVSDIRALTKTH